MPRSPESPPRSASDLPGVDETAADWVVRQDRGLSEVEAETLRLWLAADPRHTAEFTRMGGTWSGMNGLKGLADLEAMADGVLLRAEARRQRSRWRRRFFAPALGLAAALALLLGAWSLYSGLHEKRPDHHHRVIASTSHRVVLPDGSSADLNGDTKIETDYSATERRIHLVSGEAHFTVAKNPERPFFVTAGAVTVRAVGTAFNVRLQPERVEVLVTSGKVRLEGTHAVAQPISDAAAATTNAEQGTAPGLTAGQRAVIAAPPHAARDIAISTLAPAEIDEVLSWQNTRLAFNNTPLDEVVSAFNRHNKRQLRLGDASLAKRRITGIFRSDNLDGFTRLAGAIVDVRAEESASSEIVLWPAP